MNAYNIAVLPGDGIGPEIMEQALKVLRAVGRRYDISFVFNQAHIGGSALDKVGVPLPEDTVSLCESSDAVLLGAVGGPEWDGNSGHMRPEAGLLGIREKLKLFANLRPSIVYPALKGASPLKDEVLGEGLNILIVRELTGGIYFGRRGRIEQDGQSAAFDTEQYSESEIVRVLEVAFAMARKRNRRLCSVDKANVLESSRLWREVASRVALKYPDVVLTHMYVDNAAMQLVRAPRQFDTIVTSNMFGDILSDEASQITGSIGMLPSASIGSGTLGLYEPVHGSAPDIAGMDVANPMAMILSAAMMLRYSLGLHDAAEVVESAVSRALDSGVRTADIAGAGDKVSGTRETGDAVAECIIASACKNIMPSSHKKGYPV